MSELLERKIHPVPPGEKYTALRDVLLFRGEIIEPVFNICREAGRILTQLTVEYRYPIGWFGGCVVALLS